MSITLDGTNGITTPDLESSGPISGTTGTFSGDVTLGSSVLATPSGSAPSYTCRAWVNFNGTGTVAIRASGNVTSITDHGTGEYTVNFTTALPDRNYTVTQCAGNTAANACYLNVWVTPTASSCRFLCRSDAAATIDANECNVAIFR